MFPRDFQLTSQASPIRRVEVTAPPQAQAVIREGRIEALDGLRGLMALAVVVYHLSAWTRVFGSATRASSAVAALGVYSVEGFFVISGFCFFQLYGSIRFDARDLGRFHVRRFFRIAPLYYFALALHLLLNSALWPSVDLQRLLENVTLTFGFFHPNHALVTGGWSIGIEYVFYMVFPLLAWSTRVRGAVYVWLVVAFALALPYFFHHVGAATQAQKFHVYVRPLSHAFLFLAGGAIVDLRRRTQLRLAPLVVYAGLLALLTLALSHQALVVDHVDLLEGTTRLSGVGASVLAVLLCACTREGRSRGLEGFVWLGEHSYALYLLHPFTQWLTQRALAAGAGRVGAFALGLASSLLLAALAHRVIERPCMSLGRRVSG